jgi:predicted transcriptional regulator
MNKSDIKDINITPNSETLLGIAKILPCSDKETIKQALKPIEKKIGERLKERRDLAHMTQKELAEKIGQSQSQIVKVESGSCNPTLRTLLLIMAAIEMKVRKDESPCERIMVKAEEIQWVASTARLREAVQLMREGGFSQLPVFFNSTDKVEKGAKAKLNDFDGFIDETSMLEEDVDMENGKVALVRNKETKDWVVRSDASFEDLREQFRQGKNALMVYKLTGKEEVIVGIVTKSDMLRGNFKPKEVDQQSSV